MGNGISVNFPAFVTVMTVSIILWAWIKLVKTGPVCTSKAVLTGKTVLITGANCGIGKATAIELAKRAARVIIACRNEQRSNEAVAEIRRLGENEMVHFMKLDLSDFDDVRRFVAEFIDTEPKLDILVNNAGIALPGKAKNGLNLIFATNQLGPFLLTHLLMPLLKKTSEKTPVRIVNVSADAYMVGQVDFDNLSPELGDDATIKEIVTQYCNSKLMNIYFTTELNKRLRIDDPESRVTTFALHPGVIVSGLGFDFVKKSKVWLFIRDIFMYMACRSGFYGAQTTLYCCLEEGLESKSGKYFSDMKLKELKPIAMDPEIAQKLWKKCEELTGIA